ncbi:MAG: hypothetical protein CL578_17515 [Alteromonadaceae bacterium]|jgi:hypothetical protein|uniref:Uncharacterized protein n=1 Tax=Paraglaciecola agarilytica NO2 TaxID=1125747 RepID=A0ABQ0I8J7_9ALTE|nr:hypothetical protein [Paraglaciecola agarilytica]MBN26830.1 hypothetical protein [Alteromonadaceae bacterium]GAC05673.1 hypothetical protein GAGA_2834 [Paraglaciecola agarilytica NO2]|tara:strand:+ start:4393 stop:4935 length:543 start_codon:yes stop_codon:yes gene_type:complete
MKDYDYYTVDEILKALESNTDEVLTRTVILSKHIVGKSGLAIKAEEVFNEALVRILDDDRHIPKDMPLTKAICNVMRSICSGMAERNQEKIFKHSESFDEHEEAGNIQNIEDDDTTDSRWSVLLNNFNHDDVAMRFLAATQEGQNKLEILESVFAGDEKAYDTTRRRIVRNGQKYLKETG